MKPKPMHRASAEPAKRATLKLIGQPEIAKVVPVDKRDHVLYQSQMLLFGRCYVCEHGRVHPIRVAPDGMSTQSELCEECTK